MEVVSISVSELKCACLDAEWRQRWLAGQKPSTQHFAPPGTDAVGGSLFHSLVERFVAWLASTPATAVLAKESELWARLYACFAEVEIEGLASKGKIETAVSLSGALQTFCQRIAQLRRDASGFSQWTDIFLTQEHKVKDVHFTFGSRSIFVSGVIDAVRLHPQHGFEIVDYKLSRGANFQHDLVQLAIYGRLLELAEPGLQFCACLEYYLPELDPLVVSRQELSGIFNDLVVPVLSELSGGGGATIVTSVPSATEPALSTPLTDISDDVAERIEACFKSFSLPVVVAGRQEGPQLVRYTVQPAGGVKVVSLANRAEDLQVALSLGQAPRISPSAGGVTIDIPKLKPETVLWRDVVKLCPPGPVTFPVGVAVDSTVITADLSDPNTCHALVAGASGSGKSEWLRAFVATLISRSPPETLRFALIDPKMLTFAAMGASPHMLEPVMTELAAAQAFLNKAMEEMDRRYAVLAKERFSNLRERQAAGRGDLALWVIVFDEFADLILAGREEKKQFEAAVARLAGKGRAAGIHLILATQRPDRNIVTGLIKANLPLKICLRVTTAMNSQIVLDEPGAEKLLGRGDLLCDCGRGIQRAQSPFVSSVELAALVE
jgi:S-DNA-T family DNA segregation ATPase FtsK/SpoIIIE